MKVTSDVIVVTPEMAGNYLTRNIRNRNLNEAYAREIASAMSRGEWKMNAETIKFSRDDLLLDGQHRLRAIQISGVAVPIMIVRGLENESFDTMDQGMKRTVGHILSISGEKDANNLAAIIRLYMIIKANPAQPNFSAKFSPQAVEKSLRTNPTFREALMLASKLNNVGTCSTSGAMWMLFQEKNHRLACEFMERLGDGAELSKYNPIKTLRDALIVNKVAQRKLQKRDVCAFYIKAWNAMRKGSDLKIMRLQEREDFPIVI